MGLTRIELENFTAFRSLQLDLCPGVNVLVGANGTGKTHLMKVCYAACDASRNRGDRCFGPQTGCRLPAVSAGTLHRLVRRQEGVAGVATILVRLARGDATS